MEWWVAMPFGMCNAPATFERMTNDILRDFLHKLVTVYLDDVCVHSRTLEEYMEHLRLILQRLKEEGLKSRLKKCFFGLQEIEYLDYTVSSRNFLLFDKESRGRCILASDYDAEGDLLFRAILQLARQVHSSF
jgi:hypothetical protein